MRLCDEDIYRIIKHIWNSMLGLNVTRRKEALLESPETRFLTGYVQISGAWNGVFRLDCSFYLARRIAAIMFRFDLSQTSVEDIRDALGEMTNITGGNTKGLLPEPSRLALPVVVLDGSGYANQAPANQIVTQINLECEREPLRVTLLSFPNGSRLDNSAPEIGGA